MTINVRMLSTRGNKGGGLLLANTSYAIDDDAFALELIGYGWAVDTDARRTDDTQNMTLRRVSAASFALLSVGQRGVVYEIADQPGRPQFRWSDELSRFTAVGPAPVPRASDGARNRVWELGDSITHRRFRTLSAVTVASVTGQTAVFTSANAGALLGGRVRVTNANEEMRRTFGIVTASDASGFSVTWPSSVPVSAGILGASANLYLHEHGNDTGWVNYADAVLSAQGRDVQLCETYAVGGAQTAEMLARWRALILPNALPGDILRLMGGINDVEVNTPASVIANLNTICAEAQADGLIVHLGTITPAGAAGYFSNATNGLAQIAQINGAIRMMGRRYAAVRVWDGHAALVSGSYATAGTTESAGVHPTPTGAALLGARYVQDCGADFGKASVWRWSGVQDDYVDASSTQLLVNPSLAGATGATGPTSWTTSGSSNTWSLTAHSTGAGNDLRLDKAATGGNSTTLSQDITGKVAAGDRLRFGGELQVNTIGQGHYVWCEMVFTVGGVEQIATIGRQQFTVALGGSLPPVGTRWRMVGECVVPAGATAVAMRWTMRQDAAGSMAVTIAQPFVRKVA